MDADKELHEIADEDPNLYREAALRFLRLLNYVLERMPDSVEKWGIGFATGSLICQGMTMTEVAKKLGVSRAALSHVARKCITENGLPNSVYMKSERASVAARKARHVAVDRIYKQNKRNEYRIDN